MQRALKSHYSASSSSRVFFFFFFFLVVVVVATVRSATRHFICLQISPMMVVRALTDRSGYALVVRNFAAALARHDQPVHGWVSCKMSDNDSLLRAS